MKITLPHPLSGDRSDLIGSPINLEKTPVSYRGAPPTPRRGHGEDVLDTYLGLTPETRLQQLAERGILGTEFSAARQRAKPRNKTGVDDHRFADIIAGKLAARRAAAMPSAFRAARCWR